jgi:TPR repeat protein
MKRHITIGGALLAVQIWGAMAAFAGPWEDGMAAYTRGDYVPALQVFRAMAREGNSEAQRLLGTMYRRGQGVKRSSTRAFLWFNRAAAHGDMRAKAELRVAIHDGGRAFQSARGDGRLRGLGLQELSVLKKSWLADACPASAEFVGRISVFASSAARMVLPRMADYALRLIRPTAHLAWLAA